MPHFQNEQGKRKTPANPIARARSRTIIGGIFLVLILFIASRDPAWWPAWAYVAMLFVSSLLPLCGPFRFDKGLIEERLSRKPDAKRWDRYFVGLVAVFTIAELMFPGQDHRFGWTAPSEPWTQLSGLILALLGTAGLLWALKVNRFFSALIRIQKDRQHCVVSDGPYRMVRHTGYALWCLRTLGIPILFGSGWTFIVAFLFIAMFVVRTMLEDRLLLEELPG
jgi:protein-S-isoprenylcysteine O-methyltransferase Ste14